MFGIIRGCRCHLDSEARRSWQAHICGLCLALRDHHGQLSRMTTNFDAAFLSVLCEAQSEKETVCVKHACPLRRFRRMDVVAPTNQGAQFAATISQLMAATKIEDHLADGDGWWRLLSGMVAHLADQWWQTGTAAAARLGFDSHLIETQIRQQSCVEQQQKRPFAFYSRPTQLATAAAFSHTALIAGQPINLAPLQRLGSAFGRIVVLLDAYQDYAADRAGGHFNALAASCSPTEVQGQAQHLFRDAHRDLRQAVGQLVLPNPLLARALLVGQLAHNGRQILARSVDSGEPLDQEVAEEGSTEEAYPQAESYSSAGYCECSYCIGCCPDDCDCDNCDCGDCDCGECNCEECGDCGDCGDCECGDCGDCGGCECGGCDCG